MPHVKDLAVRLIALASTTLVVLIGFGPSVSLAATPMQQAAWFASAPNRYMDVDNYPAGHVYQCVDVADDYCNAMFGSYRFVFGTGDAGWPMWNATKPGRVTKILRDATHAFPEHGDIVMWTGHVAVVDSADASGMWVMEQNYAQPDGTTPCARHHYDGYSGVIGWIRPIMDPPSLSLAGSSEPTSPFSPVVPAGVRLSRGPYLTGDTITGTLRVTNSGGRPGIWAPPVLAFRGPSGQNRDARASMPLLLKPGESATVRFSRTLDLEGPWTGSVCAQLLGRDWETVPGSSVAFRVARPTGTIRVRLGYDDWSYLLYSPHINAARIHVYGPNGYYRSASFAGTGQAGKTVAFSFAGAPEGPYRVRVVWSAGNDSSAVEANQYFATSLPVLNHTCDFGSP